MRSSRVFSIVSAICGFAVMALALMVIWGWCTDDLAWAQVVPHSPAMKFNTAFLFFLCGLMLVTTDKRPIWFSPALSVVICIFALLTLSQYLFTQNLGIDTMFFYPHIGDADTGPGRMAINTAVAFVLFSLGSLLLLFGNKSAVAEALVALLGSAVAVLGAVPFVGLISKVEVAYLWGDFTHMAINTAACFIFLGICLVGHAWKRSKGVALWLPIPICFGLIILAFALADAVKNQEENKLASEIQSRADHVSLELTQELNDLYQALDRIAIRWNASNGTPRNLWEADARAYLVGYPFLSAISKTDLDNRIDWVVSREGGPPKNRGFKLDSEPQRAEAIREALASKSSHTTAPLKLLTGIQGFLYISPLFAGDRYDGLQVAVFTLSSVFKNILTSDELQQFSFVIKNNDVPVFSSAVMSDTAPHRWAASAKVKNYDAFWVLTLTPTKKFLATRGSLVPFVVLGVGLLTAFLIAFCVLLILKGQKKTLMLERRERDLEASSNLNNAILSSTAHMIIACDLEGKVILFNPQAEKLLGHKAADILGKQTPNLWHDQGEVEVRAAELSKIFGEEIRPGMDVFNKVASIKGFEQREWTFISQDGSRFPGLLSSTPLRADGEIVGYLGVVADITERKRFERALRESQETLQTTMEHAPIGMALVDLDGGWLKVNHALCVLLGYSREALLDISLDDLVYEEDIAAGQRFNNDIRAGKIETYSMEKRYVHREGHIISTILNVSLVKRGEGKSDYLIQQIQDITERMEIERIKSEFVSVVSHELRTPLTSIRGSLGLVVAGLAGAISEKAAELLTIAHRNSERLVRLINDILDVEKIESGKIRLHLQTAQASTILKEALEANEAYGEKFKVHFRLADPKADAEILVDCERLMQVLTNLLSNAAKFSCAGGEVLVHLKTAGDKARIEIEDFGEGIPTEFQGRIFTKFAQADSSSTRRFEGTGLGLSISKQLVELMGGEIGFRTSLGIGTTFFFDVPLASSVGASMALSNQKAPLLLPETKAVEILRAGPVPRILHVEDDRDLHLILAEALLGRAEIVFASSVATARKALKNDKFDLIVLDISLPDGSGAELLDDLEATGCLVPVLILSVREVPSEIQNRVAGALVKLSVNETKIAGTILSMLGKINPCPELTAF